MDSLRSRREERNILGEHVFFLTCAPPTCTSFTPAPATQANLWMALCSSGYGSVASPAKEEKIVSNKNDSPIKQSPPSESTQEMVDGRKMFETWLFDKLPFITATELQVRKCSYWESFSYSCSLL